MTMIETPAFDAEQLAALKRELARDEGLRLRVYRCTAGKRTVGYGRNLDDVGIRAAESAELGITTASVLRKGGLDDVGQARALLEGDIETVVAELDRKLPWWRDLSPSRRRVLANMAFNLGIAGLLGFRNTLAAVRDGRWETATRGMLASKWARQVGARAVRLAAMMRSG